MKRSVISTDKNSLIIWNGLSAFRKHKQKFAIFFLLSDTETLLFRIIQLAIFTFSFHFSWCVRVSHINGGPLGLFSHNKLRSLLY